MNCVISWCARPVREEASAFCRDCGIAWDANLDGANILYDDWIAQRSAAHLGAEIAARIGAGLIGIPHGATYTIAGADWTGPKVCARCGKAGTKTADGKAWLCNPCGIWIGERPKEEPEPKIDVPRPRIEGSPSPYSNADFPALDLAKVIKSGIRIVHQSEESPGSNWNWDGSGAVKLEGAKQ